jgi:LCP family protein required for cell wall assembly
MPESPPDDPGADAAGRPLSASAPDTASSDTTEPRLTRSQRRGARRAERSRLWKIVLIGVGIVLGLAVLVAGAGAGFLYYENGRIHRVVVKHLAKVRTGGAQKDVENILLIGSTTRCGLDQQNIAFGLCDEGVTGVNSDVVMILHLDPDHDRASVLSIPRDTFVPNARPGGVNKIDAALGSPDGPGQLIAAITDDFGIPIQHYVELNFDSFQGVVNALGGIRMYFPMPVFDAESGLDIPSAGCTTLDGFQALEVVRARHLQYEPPEDAGSPQYDWPYDPQSDLSRIRRDHEFLRVLASAVARRGLGNFVTDLQLINSISGNLEVDSGFSATAMAGLVLDFHNLDPDAVPQYTLPVVEDGQEYLYQGGDYGDVVFPVQPEDREAVAQFLGTAPTQDASGQTLPALGSFTVAVENGSGRYDQGAHTAAALDQLGYDVTSVTNTPEGASTTETTVLYSNVSQLADALEVQSSLSGLTVIGYDPGLIRVGVSGGRGASGLGASTTSTIDVGSTLSAAANADVVVVTGSNFAVNPPATAVPATTVPGSSTTTSSSSPSANGSTTSTTVLGPLANSPNLATPSGATEPLEPWDPRSCAAGGGPGP